MGIMRYMGLPSRGTQDLGTGRERISTNGGSRMEKSLLNIEAWCWRYLDNTSDYPGLHFTAKPAACDARTSMTSVNSTISELTSLLRSLLTPRIKLTVDVPLSEITVIGNREQLQNAVMNLCVNARDAISASGSLRVSVSLDRVNGVACRVCAQEVSGNFAAITVSDDGEGIPPEIQDRIFEPFFTTKAEGKGTGLGLAAVVGCVTAHHGHLLLDSTPGRGATFRILIPVMEAPTKNLT